MKVFQGRDKVRAGGQNTRVIWAYFTSSGVRYICPIDTGKKDEKGNAIMRADGFDADHVSARS